MDIHVGNLKGRVPVIKRHDFVIPYPIYTGISIRNSGVLHVYLRVNSEMQRIPYPNHHKVRMKCLLVNFHIADECCNMSIIHFTYVICLLLGLFNLHISARGYSKAAWIFF